MRESIAAAMSKVGVGDRYNTIVCHPFYIYIDETIIKYVQIPATLQFKPNFSNLQSPSLKCQGGRSYSAQNIKTDMYIVHYHTYCTEHFR